jgi:hypothetical protein
MKLHREIINVRLNSGVWGVVLNVPNRNRRPRVLGFESGPEEIISGPWQGRHLPFGGQSSFIKAFKPGSIY